MKLLCKKCELLAQPNFSMSGDHIKASCFQCGGYLQFVKLSDMEVDDLKNLRAWEEKETGVVSEYKRGFIDGITCFAWWKDGIEYVGTTGMTLKQAKETVDNLMEQYHG